MLYEVHQTMADSITVARKIRKYKWETFQELEKLMKLETNHLKKLMILLHHDLSSRNPRYMH